MYTLHQVITRPEVSRSTYNMHSIMEADMILDNSWAQMWANYPWVVIILCVLQPVEKPCGLMATTCNVVVILDNSLAQMQAKYLWVVIISCVLQTVVNIHNSCGLGTTTCSYFSHFWGIDQILDQIYYSAANPATSRTFTVSFKLCESKLGLSMLLFPSLPPSSESLPSLSLSWFAVGWG